MAHTSQITHTNNDDPTPLPSHHLNSTVSKVVQFEIRRVIKELQKGVKAIKNTGVKSANGNKNQKVYVKGRQNTADATGCVHTQMWSSTGRIQIIKTTQLLMKKDGSTE